MEYSANYVKHTTQETGISNQSGDISKTEAGQIHLLHNTSLPCGRICWSSFLHSPTLHTPSFIQRAQPCLPQVFYKEPNLAYLKVLTKSPTLLTSSFLQRAQPCIPQVSYKEPNLAHLKFLTKNPTLHTSSFLQRTQPCTPQVSYKDPKL